MELVVDLVLELELELELERRQLPVHSPHSHGVERWLRRREAEGQATGNG